MGLLREFRQFAVRGNAVDMAVGLIVGAKFNEIINSFVKNIILPPFSIVTGKTDFSARYFLLSGGRYSSLQEAEAAGAILVKYGEFLNQVIDFTIIAFVVFMVIRTINKLREKEDKKEEERKEEEQKADAKA